MDEFSRTWDGQPIASEAPTGAAVIVYRRTDNGVEFLLLHRAHHGPEYEGDWAWTPPSGARLPGESIEACARRELLEEVGVDAPVRPTEDGPLNWALFTAEVTNDVEIVLHDSEHDKFEWVRLSVAMKRCRPERVARGMEWVAQQIGA